MAHFPHLSVPTLPVERTGSKPKCTRIRNSTAALYLFFSSPSLFMYTLSWITFPGESRYGVRIGRWTVWGDRACLFGNHLINPTSSPPKRAPIRRAVEPFSFSSPKHTGDLEQEEHEWWLARDAHRDSGYSTMTGLGSTCGRTRQEGNICSVWCLPGPLLPPFWKTNRSLNSNWLFPLLQKKKGLIYLFERQS